MKILVVVPAYNEATTIASVLSVLKTLSYNVVVVNDGSTDQTEKIARSAGVFVLTHVVNRGLGAALRTGFAYAVQSGYDVAVTLDADGQHDPTEVSRLVAQIEQGADVVVGTRQRVAMPVVRQFYTALGALITTMLLGGSLFDSQSGFRAIRCSVLKKFSLTTSRMEISSEILHEAHRLGLSVHEAPISVQYTEYSMSKGQGFFEGIRTTWALILKSFS